MKKNTINLKLFLILYLIFLNFDLNAEMNHNESTSIQSRELKHNGVELKEYCLPSMGRYFCIKHNDIFPADELFDLIEMLKELQEKGSL